MDRKDNKKIKNIFSFTLAEMMVILAIFSAVSAATLPVVTARNQLGNTLTSGSSESDAWVVNDTQDILGYRSSTFPTKAAVILGGSFAETADEIQLHGFPQLVIKNNVGVNDTSHIVLLRNNETNNVPYYAGRISFGDEKGWQIAMGAHPLQYNSNTTRTNARTIAIGTFAGTRSLVADSGDYTDNIAIGYYSGVNFQSTTGNTRQKNIYLGTYSGMNTRGVESVFIGNYAGSYGTTTTTHTPAANAHSISIGNYSGYHVPTSISFVNDGFSVNVGYYASANNTQILRNVAIGNYAGAVYVTTSASIPAKYSWENVYLGNYAGYYSSNSTNVKAHKDVVAIGYYAAANSQASGSTYSTTFIGPFAGYGTYAGSGGVYIGQYAGAYSSLTVNNRRADLSKLNPVIIGSNAGRDLISYNNVSSVSKAPVIVGPYAFPGTATTDMALPDVAIGYKVAESPTSSANFEGSVLIGTYAGNFGGSVQKSVCIGEGACSGTSSTVASTAYHDVRIATYSNIKALKGASYIANRLDSDISIASAWSPTSSTLSQMLLSPVGASSATYTGSSIVLYANQVYGPTSTMTSFSDRRLKENIRPTKYGIDALRQINIYEYNMKADTTKEKKIGVIAQELQKIVPEAVIKNSDGYLMVLADWVQYIVIQSIKDIDNTVTTLTNQVNSYVKEYNTLSSRIKTLEKEINELEKENKVLTHEVKVAYKKAKKAESKK